MADKTVNANHFARGSRQAVGMDALKPVMHFQVSMLRMWADSIERLAGNYEKALDETAIEEQPNKERAA